MIKNKNPHPAQAIWQMDIDGGSDNDVDGKDDPDRSHGFLATASYF